MKKYLSIFLSLLLILTVFITGCNSNSDSDCSHEYGEWSIVKVATNCLSEGTKERKCSLCGHVDKQTYVGEHDGRGVEWKVEGKNHYKICRVCHERFDMGEHEYVNGTCKCGQKKETVFDIIDNVIEIEEDRDVKVLFLSDTQIIDASQAHQNRLPESYKTMWGPDKIEDLCFKYIRKAVETAKPDLIIMLGDNVYGEFDDNGTVLTQLIAVMDSFKIPWAPVNGNHDNESAKGAKWQNAQFEASEYCLFKKGNTDGNGNYTVAIKQDSKIVRIFYLMDSNHCYYAYSPSANNVVTSKGFTQNQVKWMYDKMNKIEQLNGSPIKSTLCFHVATNEYNACFNKYSLSIGSSNFTGTLNKSGCPTALDGDFGSYYSSTQNGWNVDTYNVPSAYDLSFLQICKKFAVDSVFCGHIHEINTSILYEGIRWTFGLKSSQYDSYVSGEVGGTQMSFNASSFNVKHLYYDSAIQAIHDGYRK